MKTAIRVAIGGIVVLVLAAFAAFYAIDRIAHSSVETNASEALGVPTTLQSARVRIFSQRFDMGHLNVQNPEGFDAPHFIHFDNGRLEAGLGDLMKEVIEVPRLRLDGITIHLESKEGKENYQLILDHLAKIKEADEKDGRQFIIRRVEMTDVTVHLNLLPAGGELTRMELHIDEIVLTDVGTADEGGLPIRELTGVVSTALFAAIVERGAGEFPDYVIGAIGQGLARLEEFGRVGLEIAGEAFDGVGELLGSVAEVAGELGELINEGAGEALQGLGDLFGGGGDEDEDE